MPFIKTKVSCKINKAQEEEIKSRMEKAIELVPGKSEEYLLLEFESGWHLWLRGNNTEPIAYIEAAIFGNELHYGYDKFTAKVTEIISDVLGITGTLWRCPGIKIYHGRSCTRCFRLYDSG